LQRGDELVLGLGRIGRDIDLPRRQLALHLFLPEDSGVYATVGSERLQLGEAQLGGLYLGPAERREQIQRQADNREIEERTAKKPTDLWVGFREEVLLSGSPVRSTARTWKRVARTPDYEIGRTPDERAISRGCSRTPRA
jgi:hypothetical protein